MSAVVARVPAYLVRAQASLTDDAAATAQTARIMCGHIRRDTESPVVRGAAFRIAQSNGAARGGGEYGLASAVWLYVKSHVTFAEDDSQIARLFGERDQRELLISPAVLLADPDPKGDCDDFTMAVCALLAALGIRAQVVCICCDATDPSRFSHVYARALVNGRWLAIDSSHGAYPGWAVPASQTFRLQAWDINGNCAEDTMLARPAEGK